MNEFKDEILSLREITQEYLTYNDISLTKMARITKIPKTSLYTWLCNKRELDAHSISKIKDFLGGKYNVPVKLIIANLITKKNLEGKDNHEK